MRFLKFPEGSPQDRMFGPDTGFDWNHVVLAGYPVYSFVLEPVFSGNPYLSFDLFLVGLTPAEALEKIEEILYHLETSDKSNIGSLIRTSDSIAAGIKSSDYPIRISL